MAFVVESLGPHHQRGGFACGEPALDEYIRRYARQNQERSLGRTFVAVPAGERRVVGFYTLSAGSVELSAIPEALRRRLPRYPVPVARLGRLATCQSVQGRGLGEALLFDALRRSLRAADELGIVAMEVRAKNDRVRTFYSRYGFQSLIDDPHHLYLPLTVVRRLI